MNGREIVLCSVEDLMASGGWTIIMQHFQQLLISGRRPFAAPPQPAHFPLLEYPSLFIAASL